MAQFYKILKADTMGDPYTAHGNQLQSYWCQFEGVENSVMLSKKVGNTPQVGTHVYGDLVYAMSQKGNQYWKFKGSQVPEGVPFPADTPAQATAQEATGATPSNVSGEVPAWFRPVAAQLADMQKKLDYVYNDLKGVEPDVPFEEPKVEQVGGEPLDEKTKQQLDAIFGEPEDK